MQPVTIHPLSPNDAEELLAFEVANRAFFAAQVGDRGDAYFQLDYLKELLTELAAEQELGRRYMYLIRDGAGALVGRVNLVDVARGDLQKAELGYRIGEAYQGRGYATAAVRLVMREAFGPLGLHRLEAATSPRNIGSQIVLIKNGFQFVGRWSQAVRINGVWEDSLQFECVSP